MALYRLERDGWTLEDVQTEMTRQTYRQGWLPGYVFGMVRDRPDFETTDADDRPAQEGTDVP